MTRRPAGLVPQIALAVAQAFALVGGWGSAAPVEARESREDDTIEIVHGEDRTIYEYRQNGVLRIIKVVPERGRPYYLVPESGEAPFEGLDHAKKLYPRWVIIEW